MNLIDNAKKGHHVPKDMEQSPKMEQVTEEEKKITAVSGHSTNRPEHAQAF